MLTTGAQVCCGGDTGLVCNAGQDCSGLCGGRAFLDDCKMCVAGNTGKIPNWAMDCQKVCNGTAELCVRAAVLCIRSSSPHSPAG